MAESAKHGHGYVSGLEINGSREDLLATIGRLRAQNKASAESHDKAVRVLQKKYDRMVSLFRHAIEAATRGERQGVCAICYQEHKHPNHRHLTQCSQLEGALYALMHYGDEDSEMTSHGRA